MTTEEHDPTAETAVSDTDDTPSQTTAQTKPRREGRGELVKFGLLILVFVGVIVGVALARPLIFDQIIPAIIGENLAPTPTVGVGGEAEEAVPVETAVPDAAPAGEAAGDVFLPALTTDVEAGQPTAAPAEAATAVPQPITHVVQPGDNLTKIAKQYNVPVQALMEANNLLNANYIQVGQTLVIPPNP